MLLVRVILLIGVAVFSLLACVMHFAGQAEAEDSMPAALSEEETEEKMQDYRTYVSQYHLQEDIIFAGGGFRQGGSDHDKDASLEYVKLRFNEKNNQWDAYIPSDLLNDLHIYFKEFKGIQFGDDATIYYSGDAIPVGENNYFTSVRLILWDDSTFSVTDSQDFFFYYGNGTASLYLDTGDADLSSLHGENKVDSIASDYSIYNRDSQLVSSGALSVLDSDERGGNYNQRPMNLNLSSGEVWKLLPDYVEAAEEVRNKAALDMARALELPGTAYADFVNVYNRGEYLGLYLLTSDTVLPFSSEPGSVEEATQKGADFSSTVAWEEAPEEVKTYAAWFNEHYDDDTGLSDEEQGVQVYKKLWDVLDQESFLNMYLLQEFMASWQSSFSVGTINAQSNISDTKLYAGNPWDYVLSCGYNTRLDYPTLMRQSLLLSSHIRIGDGTSVDDWESFLSSLGEWKSFREKLEEQYRTIFEPLMEDYLQFTLPIVTYETVGSGTMCNVRFDQEQIEADTSVWNFRQWMRKRGEFLTNYIEHKDQYTELVFSTALGNLKYYSKNDAVFGISPVTENGEGTSYYGQNGKYAVISGWIDENGSVLSSDTVITDGMKGEMFSPVSESHNQ